MTIHRKDGTKIQVDPPQMWQPSMDIDYVDDLKKRVEGLSEEQLAAMWKWVTSKYMSVASRRRTPLAPDLRESGQN